MLGGVAVRGALPEPPGKGHEPAAGPAGGPFCQAPAPAAAAALACAHFSRASSLGGTSISSTQRRVAASRWAPPTARPARASMTPPPMSAAPVISGPDLSWRPLVLLCVSVMAPSSALVGDRYCGRAGLSGHPPHGVITGCHCAPRASPVRKHASGDSARAICGLTPKG